MKHTILVLALFNLSAAHAAMIAPTRVSLPGVRAPQIAINPRIQLPTPAVPVIAPTAPRLTPSIVLPGAFNPSSPIAFPAPAGENTGKVVAQLGALFDGAAAKDAPAVPVVDGKAEKAAPAPKQDVPAVRAERGNSHLTLPENDLLNEIGF